MPYSNRCGVFTNMEELGICPECKEHCEFETPCHACAGSGEIDEKKCPVCEGEGMKTIEP